MKTCFCNSLEAPFWGASITNDYPQHVSMEKEKTYGDNQSYLELWISTAVSRYLNLAYLK